MKAPNIPRRLLLSSAAGALALTSSRAAQADTNFANFSFAATGAPTARTMPDRLSDIVNVKDWGALGNNSTDDTTAIQNAINYCISRGGGKVFFPQGQYMIGRPLVVGSSNNVGVQLIGTGKFGSFILPRQGYSDPNRFGSMISKGNQTYDNIECISGIGGISVKATRSGVSIIDCSTGAGENQVGIDVASARGAAIRDCVVNAAGRGAVDPRPGSIRGTTPGSIGFAVGTGIITGCRGGGGLEVAVALSGYGSLCTSCSFETLGCAVRVGWSAAGETPSYGASIVGLQTERVMIPIDLYNATGAFVAANVLTGGAGTALEAPVSNMTWSNGVAIVTTPTPHFIPAGTNKLQLIINNTGGPNNNQWIPDIATTQSGLILVTTIDATHFRYPLASNPGVFNATAKQYWNWPLLYSIRCRKVTDSMIAAHWPSDSVSMGTVDLDYNGQAQHNNNAMIGVIGTHGWILPSNPKNLASWKFINCGGSIGVYGDNAGNPYGTMHFADLPGQTGVLQPGPFETQEYDIIDGAKFGGGSATWNDQVQGGGSGHYKVRYDGSVWRRIG